MLLTFHEAFIATRSFLKAVTEEASLHFLSDSPFSEIGLRKILVEIKRKVKMNFVIGAFVVLGELNFTTV